MSADGGVNFNWAESGARVIIRTGVTLGVANDTTPLDSLAHPWGLAPRAGQMNRRKTSGWQRARKGPAGTGGTGQITATDASTSVLPQEVLLRRRYRNVVRNHLDCAFDRIFAEFTGLHFHIVWAPVPPRPWDTRSLPPACSVCRRISGTGLRKACHDCGARRLARALRTDGDGYRFICRLGVRNFWLPILIRRETLGIAFLQALERPPATASYRPQPSPRLARLRKQSATCILSRTAFARATRLLRLIVEHVQTASLCDLRQDELTIAGHVVTALEREHARLRETLGRHLPAALSPTGTQCVPESHPEQVVHRLLRCVEQNYGKPITLQQCAARLGMNPSYLSDLFSQMLGVPFKRYLTDVRLQKAMELLGDPSRQVSDVAFAVGYASENRFRIAFKQATGIPPKVWRETMQPNPPRPD